MCNSSGRCRSSLGQKVLKGSEGLSRSGAGRADALRLTSIAHRWWMWQAVSHPSLECSSLLKKILYYNNNRNFSLFLVCVHVCVCVSGVCACLCVCVYWDRRGRQAVIHLLGPERIELLYG